MSTIAVRLAAAGDEIRRIARQLNDDLTGPGEDIHPDTAAILTRRGGRAQIHPHVPVALALPERLRTAATDRGVPVGDVAALALDAWLRANGYPPPDQAATSPPQPRTHP